MSELAFRSLVALSGGVGGARFVDGLARVVDPETLTVIVNTGDDFEHWGLWISPDLDTVMYTLAGLSDDERGWGLENETFSALERVGAYGGEDWFSLGDRDLATHLVRTDALKRGQTLSEVTATLCEALGVRVRVLPMADTPRSTMIDTDQRGTLPFQQWFVRHRAEPTVRRVWYDGPAVAAPDVLPAIASADLVVIGPSNPYVSIDPILTLAGVREAMCERRVVAVSPIVKGRAVKGPLAEMIPALTGEPPSAAAVARHYGALLNAIVVEHGDEDAVRGVKAFGAETVMRNRDDRARLASEVLARAKTIFEPG